jgi:hypothetical protein
LKLIQLAQKRVLRNVQSAGKRQRRCWELLIQINGGGGGGGRYADNWKIYKGDSSHLVLFLYLEHYAVPLCSNFFQIAWFFSTHTC